MGNASKTPRSDKSESKSYKEENDSDKFRDEGSRTEMPSELVVLVCGAKGVGTKELVERYMAHKGATVSPTEQGKIQSINTHLQGKVRRLIKVRLEVVVGPESLSDLEPIAASAHAFVLLYSLEDQATQSLVSSVMRKVLTKHAKLEAVPKVIIGSFADSKRRAISPERVRSFAEGFEAAWLELNSDYHAPRPFEKLAEEIERVWPLS